MCIFVKIFYISKNFNSSDLITSFNFAREPQIKDLSGKIMSSTLIDSVNSDLKDFLSRPIRIQSLSWTPGTSINGSIDPWATFFASTAVAAKIKNFSRIRGKLHLRFLISSNSFYFGSLVFSYIPLPTLDEVTMSRTLTSPVPADFVEIMQRPHVLMDPTTSLDREIVLPFFLSL